MAEKPPLIPLDEHRPTTRDCTRWLGDHACGQPAILHVIWDEQMENGFVCEDHMSELGAVWTFYATHKVGADCAMPGSQFVEEENTCRCPDSLAGNDTFVASSGSMRTAGGLEIDLAGALVTIPSA